MLISSNMWNTNVYLHSSFSCDCKLQSTTAISCSQYISNATPLTPGGSPVTLQTQLLCSPLVTYLPVRVTAGVGLGNGSGNSSLPVLTVAPIPTATEGSWCASTTTSAAPSHTINAGAVGQVRRFGGGWWEVIAGGLVTLVVWL